MTVKRLTEQLAPQGTRSVLAALVGLAGLGLVLGSTAVGGAPDSAVRVGTLGAGGVMLFVGVLWESQLRYAAGAVDERQAQRYYRASWVALVALLPTSLTLSVGLTENIVSPSQTEVLGVVTAVVFGTLFAAQWAYRWVL